MHRMLLLATCLIAAACANTGRQANDNSISDDYAELRDSTCYTVDLFDTFDVQPATADVPPQYAAFLGEWGYGAWNGEWCHDLLVLSVTPGGEVDLLAMHAPSLPLNQPATVFRRKAFVDINGTLRYAHGKERHVYRIDGPYLVGQRTGNVGEFQIAMTRKGVVPSPIAKPIRLASK